MNGETREAKRPRYETNNDNDDNDKRLEAPADAAWIEGDDFISPEERQQAEAERRRQERRERLKRHAVGREPEQSISVVAAPIQTMEVDKEERQERSIPVKEEKNNTTTTTTTTITNNINNINKNTTDLFASGVPFQSEENGTESFDMFTSSPPPPPKKGIAKDATRASASAATRGQGQQDWDDVEGYYDAVIGETIELRDNPGNQMDSRVQAHQPSSLSFRVDGLIGKGVFSTVLKVTTMSNASSTAIPPTVAIKIIRHNETMAKAATNEVRFLHQLRDAKGIVPLLLPTTVNPLEHRGHVVLVFPYVEYNLRDVLQKFGKGVGISLPAVRSYFGQLLSALTHLQKKGIIHADLKPDNILVGGQDFSTVYLADFGSAFEVTAPENQPTPYLVSRFYRAPEIILGLTPTRAIDLWSLAVSMAEVFLGKVLFRGQSNNDMLYVFMQHLGSISNRVIRQHLVQLSKIPTLARQFQAEGATFLFLQQTVDTVTGNAIHKRLPLVTTTTSQSDPSQKFPLATPLGSKVLRGKSINDSRSDVQQFADLLQKSLALDPSRRLALKDALGHDFFRSKSV